MTHTLSSEGADASEDGTGRGTPIVAIPIDMRNAARDSDAGQFAGTGIGEPGDPSSDEQVPCIGGKSTGNGVMVTPLALRGREGGAELEAGQPNAPYNAPRAGDGGSSRQSLIAVERHAETIVRRLTPLECERLQGYPDGWTDNGQADSARYRQLGNSVAVPCVQWIAERLIAVDGEVDA